MAISTTITKKFFDMKLADLKESGYFIEFKEFKKHWIKQLDNFNSNRDDLNEDIVFLVGSTPHRFIAVSIWIVSHDFIPKKYQEAITTEFAYAIKCVESIKDVICTYHPNEDTKKIYCILKPCDSCYHNEKIQLDNNVVGEVEE